MTPTKADLARARRRRDRIVGRDEALTQGQLAKRAAEVFGVDARDRPLALARVSDLITSGLIVRGSDGLFRRPDVDPQPRAPAAKQPEPATFWAPAHSVRRQVQVRDETGALRTISVDEQVPEHVGPWGAKPDGRPRVRVRNLSTRLQAHLCGVAIKPGAVAELPADEVAKVNVECLGCVVEPFDDEDQSSEVPRRRSRRGIFGGR